jgi:CheY-like chemotaxis protein
VLALTVLPPLNGAGGLALSAYALWAAKVACIHKRKGGPWSLTRARILLVEDEPLIRSLLAETLLEGGLEIVEAGSGEEAVDALERHDTFDLLLTDVHMPGGISGVDVARHARGRDPGLPVVFATGRPESLSDFGTLGLREVCLAKPFSPTEALNVVKRLLSARATDTDAPDGAPDGTGRLAC